MTADSGRRNVNPESRTGAAVRNRREPAGIVAAPRYSLSLAIAAAISRGVLRLAGLVRRSILEPYARRRRRRITIARLDALDDRLLSDIGLKRHEIALAADCKLGRRGAGFSRPVEGHRPAAASRQGHRALPRPDTQRPMVRRLQR